MIILLFAACQIANPTHCKDNYRIQFDSAEMTVRQCNMFAQIPLAKWTGEHPDWMITKFSCLNEKDVAEKS